MQGVFELAEEQRNDESGFDYLSIPPKVTDISSVASGAGVGTAGTRLRIGLRVEVKPKLIACRYIVSNRQNWYARGVHMWKNR